MFPHLKVPKEEPWIGYVKPFHITDKVMFVGTVQSSTHLIDTGDGLVIIDPGYRSTFYTVVDGIYRLGYKPEDIKYAIHSHWHWDHVEGTKPLLSLVPGIRTVIGVRDDELVRKYDYFEPDIVVRDGDTLTLGDVTFRFVETPGHTIGTVSIFFDVREGDRVLHAGMFGGAGSNSLHPEYQEYYPTCREDYRNSLARLRREKVDLFLGNHTWNNDTVEKAKQFAENPAVNPFIDDKLFYRFLDHCEARLDRVIAKEKEAENKQ